MSALHILESQQSVQAQRAGRTAAGTWKLAAGGALSLHPRERSLLEITHGRAWVTLGGEQAGDHVLEAGERLLVAAGQHVVLEVWNPSGRRQDGAMFCWEAVAPAVAHGARASVGAEWECGVVQPLRDLAQAVGQGGRAVATAAAGALGAAGRLALGVGRFALALVAAPRPRRLA